MTTYPAGITRIVKVRRGAILSGRAGDRSKPTINLAWPGGAANHHRLEIDGLVHVVSTGDSTWLETDGTIKAYDGEQEHS